MYGQRHLIAKKVLYILNSWLLFCVSESDPKKKQDVITTDIKPTNTCGIDQFRCWDGSCVSSDAFCDGLNDCADRSDEADFVWWSKYAEPSFAAHLLYCLPFSKVPEMSILKSGCALWRNWECDGVTKECVGDTDELCWKAPTGNCPALFISRRCDGFIDCLDGSDEANCTYTCDTTLGSKMISTLQLCDGVDDCPDGRDECLARCGICSCDGKIFDICNTTICVVTSCRMCINSRNFYYDDQLCDEILHCEDGSDEIRCNEVVCRNGNKIQEVMLCDGVNNCSGGDDEERCFTFFCSNSRNISDHLKCDGYNDCGDHSDECSDHCLTHNKFICGSGECISRFSFCDGLADCTDGSDEATIVHSNFTKSQILCNNNYNYYEGSCWLNQETWLCDFIDHCWDRSDECSIDCTKGSFWCDNGTCIRVEAFCNGILDCADGSDEAVYSEREKHNELLRCRSTFGVRHECAIHVNHPWVCDVYTHCMGRTDECLKSCPNSFICGSGECIQRDWVCDGDMDCLDNSDEQSLFGETFTCVKTRHPVTRTCLLPLSIVNDSVGDCDRDMDKISSRTMVQTSHFFTQLSNHDVFLKVLHTTLLHNTYFQCIGESRTIPGEKQCDGTFDCALLSDECLCERSPDTCQQLCYGHMSLDVASDSCKFCAIGDIRCDDKCISRHQVCDGILDCHHGEDELFCPQLITCAVSGVSLCQPNFECHSIDYDKNRTQMAFACDGRPECTHFEDECLSCDHPLPEFCNYVHSADSEFGILVTFYTCMSSGRLLKYSEICDGQTKNCPGGEDEMECPNRIYCNDTESSTGKRPIHISPSQICNGKIDCNNMLDEFNCTDHFYCVEGEPLFVPLRAIMDGKADCVDGSDECPPSSFDGDVFASREHMIRDPVLRYLIWIMGGLSLIGNFAVLGETLYDLLLANDRFKNKRPFAKVNHVLVFNLALADLIMGIYLIILGISASQTSGRYCQEDKSWRSSATCSLLGSLTVVSCVASVLILVILTAYRLYGVVQPFKCQHVSYVTALIFAIWAWTISVFIAILPIIKPISSWYVSHTWIRHNSYFLHDLVDRNILLKFIRKVPLFYLNDVNVFRNYSNINPLEEDPSLNIHWENLTTAITSIFSSDEAFRGEFGYYSEHSVCMPKLYVTTSDVGWIQSLVIVSLIFVAFIFIVASYVYIFYKTNSVHTRKNRQTSMLRRISYLVLSDLICWLPICLMAFFSLLGNNINENAYAVSAVVLLPINSALNPLLYSNVIQRMAFKMVTCGKGNLKTESHGSIRNQESHAQRSEKKLQRRYTGESSLKKERSEIHNYQHYTELQKMEIVTMKEDALLSSTINGKQLCTSML